MTRCRALLTTSLLAVTSAQTPVFASPTVIVGDPVGAPIPFSAKELADAVQLRGDGDLDIYIDRVGDVLVIRVGDQAREVAVSGDPHDLTRTVALVIVSLAEPAVPTSTPVPPTPPSPARGAVAASPAPLATAPATPVANTSGVQTSLFASAGLLPPPKNWTFRVSAGMHAEHGGEEMIESGGRGAMIAATLSRRLSSSVHAVVGASADQAHRMMGLANRGEQTLLSARAGVELRHGWFAVEGGLSATRIVVDCEIETPEVSFDPYGTARVYLFPVGGIQNRVFMEVGARRVSTSSACIGYLRSLDIDRPSSVTTAHAALGIEVPL